MFINAKARLQADDLSPKQKKIDFNHNGKVDGDDLKKLRQGKKPLTIKSDLEDPTDGGTSYDLLVDGAPDEEVPIVQELTHDDGGIQPAEEQNLLRDDLSIFRTK